MVIQGINGLQTHEGRNELTGAHRRERPLLLPCFYFVEIPLFGAAAVLAYLLHFTNFFHIVSVDFDPLDVTISQPLTAQQNRSVAPLSVFLGTTAAPCTIIIAVECFLVVFALCCRQIPEATVGSTGCYISTSLRRIVRFVGLHLFGLLVSSIICDIIIKNLPSLSPNFLSACKVEVNRNYMGKAATQGSSNSTGNLSQLASARLFSSDDCLPFQGVDELQAARSEFPSYAVCISSYTSTYTFLYFRFLMVDAGPVLKTLVTWTTLTFPYILGLLEIAENSSHVISVIGGWVLGSGIAALMAHDIFLPKMVRSCNCETKATPEAKTLEANNMFDAANREANFSVHKYDVCEEDDSSVLSNRDDEDDILRPKSRISSHMALSVPSPAISKLSRSTCDPREEEQRKGHTAERNVIKELQNYMTETDFRGGLESPKPTQIRQMSKGGVKSKRHTVLSTFQAYPEAGVGSGDDEVTTFDLTQDIPVDLHAAGSTHETTVCGLPYNFQKSSSCEIRPFSLSPDHKSPSVDSECSNNQKKLIPPANESRPMSFTYTARTSAPISSFAFSDRPATLDGRTMESFRKESLHDRYTDPRIIYFLSDEESEGSSPKIASSITSPLVPRQKTHSDVQTNEKDVVNETSNLLREVFDVMNEKGDAGKNSDEEDRDSDETITGDQPSITV